jgi:hypothetical protein
MAHIIQEAIRNPIYDEHQVKRWNRNMREAPHIRAFVRVLGVHYLALVEETTQGTRSGLMNDEASMRH